jgi:CRP/FNR family transcriptional regulator
MKAEKMTDNCAECRFKTNICKGNNRKLFKGLFQHTQIYNYKKGETILKQGMKTDHLINLTKGMVKFYFEDENRKGLIITIDKAPTLLGLANILNEDINVVSIIAIEDCTGCLIDLTKFKLLLIRDREMMLNIMSDSTKMFRKSILNFISIAQKQAYGRIADILIYLSKNVYEKSDFVLTLSRQELAEFAGCSKELIINTLQNFDKENIIKISGKKIEILDINRLHTISKVG